MIRRHIASKKAAALKQQVQHVEKLVQVLSKSKDLAELEQSSAIRITSALRSLACQRAYRNTISGTKSFNNCFELVS